MDRTERQRWSCCSSTSTILGRRNCLQTSFRLDVAIAFGIAGSLGSQLFLRRLTPDNIVPRIVQLLDGICFVQIGNLAILPFATSPSIVVGVYGVAVGVTGAVLSVMLVPFS